MPFQFVKFLRHLSGSFSFVQPEEVSCHRHKSKVRTQSSVFFFFFLSTVFSLQPIILPKIPINQSMQFDKLRGKVV